MRKLGIYLLWITPGIASILAVLWVWQVGPFFVRVQHFEANPDKGYYSSFYVYVSPGARRLASAGKDVVLLIQPNNSGTNSDDPEVHLKDAWWMAYSRHKEADELEVVLIVPAFVRPGKDWQIYTHALDRDVLTTQRKDVGRLDIQLLNMVDFLNDHLRVSGITLADKMLIQGYSASGMFANRFTALHPKRILASAAGSPGGWPIAPVSEVSGTRLPYPAGISDLVQLVGEPFDSVAFINVPQLIVMGDLDENDSLDFTDGWDVDDANIVDSLFGNTPLRRWMHSKSLYEEVGAEADFVLVEGVGHDRRRLQIHTTEFFKAVLSR